MKTLIILLITLFFATIGFAEVSHQSEETNKKIEKIEEKLETTKEELTKYMQITDDTKERVGDISGSVDRFGLLVGLFGILMTVMVIFFSFRSTKEAKLEAKEEAQKLLKEWIEKEAKRVFEAKVNALSDELQAKGDEILRRIEDNANEQHERHEEDHKKLMLNTNPTQNEKDEVAKEAKQAEGKNEEDLTFNDYWVKIENQYYHNAYDEMLTLVEKAMKLTSINDEQRAGLLVVKGIALDWSGKLDEAIKIYDLVISTYSSSKANRLIELVATAMFNKNVILRQQDRFEEIKLSSDI
jgi:gas vesicle protein